MSNDNRVLSIGRQAALVEDIAQRCVTRTGEVAAETYVLIDKSLAVDLANIAKRLHRMAPHEPAIKAMVKRHDNA